MLFGHHKTYNIHALRALIKPIDEPLAKLGIAHGETLESIDNAVHYPRNIIKPVVEPLLAKASYELSQIDGQSDPINITQFAHTGDYGESLGGWGY